VSPTDPSGPGTGMPTGSGVILRSSGSQSLQATDANAGLISGATLSVIPPGVTLGPVSGTEGSPVTLTGSLPAGTATGASTVTIDWGDGTAATTMSLAAGPNSFRAGTTYAASSAAGSPISVLVADSAGGVLSGTGAAHLATR